MPDRRAYSDAEVQAAVQALSDPERLEAAQRVVAASAPQLQAILDQALEAGGWYGSAHQSEVLKAAGTADPEARLQAVQRLITEETRVSMLIGVAVGFELGHLLPNDSEER